jgi:hypothetical protein
MGGRKFSAGSCGGTTRRSPRDSRSPTALGDEAHWKFRQGVYSRHGTPILPPAGDDRNAAYYVALVFSAQSAKGRPFRRQSRRVTTRIQNRLRCDPIIHGIFFHCRDSRLQMVVCRARFVVGNAGIFYLQSLGLVLVLTSGGASEFQLSLLSSLLVPTWLPSRFDSSLCGTMSLLEMS